MSCCAPTCRLNKTASFLNALDVCLWVSNGSRVLDFVDDNSKIKGRMACLVFCMAMTFSEVSSRSTIKLFLDTTDFNVAYQILGSLSGVCKEAMLSTPARSDFPRSPARNCMNY